MANTEFYRDVLSEHPKITWKDIFSQSFEKHTRAHREYAMQVGTVTRPVSEADMLDTWHRPWLWWSAARFGLMIIVILVIACMLPVSVVSSWDLLRILAPLIPPFVIMILLWELNIAQNISFWDLMLYYIFGAIVSFLITAVFFLFVTSDFPPYAAFREEPGKLAAVILILWYLQEKQHKKIYAVTALTVGAAVGAAFSGIESISYALSQGSMLGTLLSIGLRGLFSLCGHILFAVPYAAAIGLHCRNGKISGDSILNRQTAGAFLFSVLLHYIWNGGLGLMDRLGLILQLGFMVLGFFIYLYWIRLSLRQIVAICAPQRKGSPIFAGSAGIKTIPIALRLYCYAGTLRGQSWTSQGAALLAGRQPDCCQICFPPQEPLISRVHCRFQLDNGVWTVQDLNATNGTFLGKQRLVPGRPYPLHPGDLIFLGSQNTVLQVL